MVRCKFICEKKTENRNGFVIELTPVIAGSEENKKFYKYTPYGKMEIGTVNHETAKQFEVGKQYYIDFTKAE